MITPTHSWDLLRKAEDIKLPEDSYYFPCNKLPLVDFQQLYVISKLV